jgi:hypothetical protein
MHITLSEQLPLNEVGKCSNTCVEAAVVLGDIVKVAGGCHTSFFVVCKGT